MRSARAALLSVVTAAVVLPVVLPAALLAALPVVLPGGSPTADAVRSSPLLPAASAAGPLRPVPPYVGPRVRVRRTVAPGAPLLLPEVDGRVRVVCTGPVMRGASYWLERGPSGRTAVRRRDGGRQYDLTYRVVRGTVSVARERCP